MMRDEISIYGGFKNIIFILKHRSWDVHAGCDHWEDPEGCVITMYLGNKFLEITLPFTQNLKSTLKNRNCDPIFQGHVCKFVDSATACTIMQSNC